VEDFDRKDEPPKEGPMKDVLWADPFEDCDQEEAEFQKEFDLNDLNDHDASVKATYKAFHANKDRGGSLKFYGYPAVCKFLTENGITGIFRGHQQKQTGIQQHKFGPEVEFPAVTTVFSAPNYCDKSQNTGGVVSITDGKVRFKTYTWALHPQFFPFDCKHDTPFARDMDTEDFIQFVNYNQHEALRKIPLCKLKGEYLAIFQKAGVAGSAEDKKGKKIDTKKIDKAIKSGGDFSHEKAMGGAESMDDKQMANIRKQAAGMLDKYQGFDHFKDALSTENLFEQDPDAKDYGKKVESIQMRNQLASSVLGTAGTSKMKGRKDLHKAKAIAKKSSKVTAKAGSKKGGSKKK